MRRQDHERPLQTTMARLRPSLTGRAASDDTISARRSHGEPLRLLSEVQRAKGTCTATWRRFNNNDDVELAHFFRRWKLAAEWTRLNSRICGEKPGRKASTLGLLVLQFSATSSSIPWKAICKRRRVNFDLRSQDRTLQLCVYSLSKNAQSIMPHSCRLMQTRKKKEAES
ncbi:hypothetical protein BDV10DRAFT_139702 [Aspergillus recurvatus]